jgi:hypothetical protein
MRISLALSLLILSAGSTCAAPKACQPGQAATGSASGVVSAVEKFRPLLSSEQRAILDKPFDFDSAIQWSNLPIGIVPRRGLRLGDLDAAQSAAARVVFQAALSACGLELLDEIRVADDFLIPFDERSIGWGGGNYYLSILGEPSAQTPWMLQLGGHHLAYNFTFNGRAAGATPLFFGTEPIRFEIRDAVHEPLSAQSAAMSTLAAAIATHPQAKLSGTFTDVVKGVVVIPHPGQMPTGGTDSGFPQSFPDGETDRGIKFSALSKRERAAVRTAIESYTALPGTAISAALLAAYEAPGALNETFVGFAGAPDFSEKGSYVRIDGPRVWMEFVVQPAVAKPTELHYHALWRDKQSDYGGEVRP